VGWEGSKGSEEDPAGLTCFAPHPEGRGAALHTALFSREGDLPPTTACLAKSD
jgi:hypothetical protein